MSILDFVSLGRDNPETLEAFAPLIPAELMPELRDGRLLGVGSLLGDMPNGAAVFELREESASLRSIYVDYYDRRHGTGSELLDALCERLCVLGGIYCLELRLPERSGGELKEFLEKNGFELYEGETKEASVSLEALKELALPKPKLAAFSGEELDGAVLRAFEARLKSDGLYFLEGSLSDEPVCKSLCRYTVENGAVSAAAVVSETPLSLAFLFGENSAALSSVLYEARAAVLSSHNGDEHLYLDAVSESGRNLAQKLLGDDNISAKVFARKTIKGV